MNHYEHSRLALAQRILRFFSRTPTPVETALVVRQHQGRLRAAAVAKYMAEQAGSLRMGWEDARDSGDLTLAAAYQAGAAASDGMSDLLLAALHNDKQGFKEALNAFVNDAVDTGVVTVG